MAGGQGQAGQADRTQTGPEEHSRVWRAAGGWGAGAPGWGGRKIPPPPRSWLERILRGDTGCAPDTVFTLCEADPTSGAPGSWEKPGTALLLWVRPPRPRRKNCEDGCPQPERHYCFPKSGSQSCPGHRYNPCGQLGFCTCPRKPQLRCVGRPLSPSFPSA